MCWHIPKNRNCHSHHHENLVSRKRYKKHNYIKHFRRSQHIQTTATSQFLILELSVKFVIIVPTSTNMTWYENSEELQFQSVLKYHVILVTWISQDPILCYSCIKQHNILEFCNLAQAPVMKCRFQPSYKKCTQTQVSQYANWVTVTIINNLW